MMKYKGGLWSLSRTRGKIKKIKKIKKKIDTDNTHYTLINSDQHTYY